MTAIKALKSANPGLSRPLDLCSGRISSLYNSAAAARPRAPHVEDVSSSMFQATIGFRDGLELGTQALEHIN
ncbi:hypothetical protein M404DRAFT_1000735 [Pisolithus tinctorius Marx 270]|uniref:Uncharacterized protein n=1 Tax=Pisolithus tinctorius Marx 270 TaxID=870435 RepID=A0A0C3NTJ2_PISTI|nr:hypothetical protein M404DRAFT_1000735 [Pisolithus tinctorius Marx 270]